MESVKSHGGELLSIYAITISKHYCNTNELIIQCSLGIATPAIAAAMPLSTSHPIDWPLFGKIVTVDVLRSLLPITKVFANYTNIKYMRGIRSMPDHYTLLAFPIF